MFGYGFEDTDIKPPNPSDQEANPQGLTSSARSERLSSWPFFDGACYGVVRPQWERTRVGARSIESGHAWVR